MKLEIWQLKQLQSLSLRAKIARSERKIREWYAHWEGEVYVSFSGGKDSTVLLDIVRSLYPNVPAVFADTGLEYPEIRKFVKTIDNVEWLRPSKNFKQVIEEYGYPVVSKDVAQKIYDFRTTKSDKLRKIRMEGNDKGHGKLPEKWKYLLNAPFPISDRCCHIMKKNPFSRYERRTNKRAILGTMAEESSLRTITYMRYGCNSFDKIRKTSSPLGFWNNEDILEYLNVKDVAYCSVYGDIVKENGKLITTGEKRTGCMFCMFGVHLEKGENRFQRMQRTHPKLWKYCMEKLQLNKVLDYIDCPFEIRDASGIFDKF